LWRLRHNTGPAAITNRDIAASAHAAAADRAVRPADEHNRVMDRSINSQRVIERLFRPFPPKVEGTAREF
jgi:hypothetical protein